MMNWEKLVPCDPDDVTWISAYRDTVQVNNKTCDAKYGCLAPTHGARW